MSKTTETRSLDDQFGGRHYKMSSSLKTAIALCPEIFDGTGAKKFFIEAEIAYAKHKKTRLTARDLADNRSDD